MSLVRLKGVVDKSGHLSVVVPWPTDAGEVDVFVNRESRKQIDRAEFLLRLRETFGMDPDFSVPDQGDLPPSAIW